MSWRCVRPLNKTSLSWFINDYLHDIDVSNCRLGRSLSHLEVLDVTAHWKQVIITLHGQFNPRWHSPLTECDDGSSSRQRSDLTLHNGHGKNTHIVSFRWSSVFMCLHPHPWLCVSLWASPLDDSTSNPCKEIGRWKQIFFQTVGICRHFQI